MTNVRYVNSGGVRLIIPSAQTTHHQQRRHSHAPSNRSRRNSTPVTVSASRRISTPANQNFQHRGLFMNERLHIRVSCLNWLHLKIASQPEIKDRLTAVKSSKMAPVGTGLKRLFELSCKTRCQLPRKVDESSSLLWMERLITSVQPGVELRK